jgi:penicillin-binding protein 2
MTSKLGYLFDFEMQSKVGNDHSVNLSGRVRSLKFFLIIIFVVLTFKLVWLQIFQGERNRVLSDENRILARRIQAPRGVITDRRGEVLVQNIPIYKLVNENCIQGVDISNTSHEEICAEFKEISREEALKLTASGEGRGVLTLVGRSYVYDAAVAHLVGYAGEIDKDELIERPEYGLGDLIGKMGVELVYEDVLHGKNGAELIEIDAHSSVVREVAKKEAVPGKDLQLSVDIRLQKKAHQLLEGREGAIISINPNKGEVLSLVSSPTFDPNDVAASLGRDDEPFFSRVSGGLYPPGSVFKIVTSIAGLEEGKINRETEFEDTGEIRIGPYRYGNWYFDQYGRKEGFLNIVEAIKRSNDIFFYRVGEKLGATKLSDWAKLFGFGRTSGVDLTGEVEGLVPSPLWKERIKGEKWFLGNTYHFAIGQSDLQVTPLQVAQMTSVIANNGKLCKPYVRGDTDMDSIECEDLGISKENLDIVKEGMVEACLPRGTAFPFFNFGVQREGQFQRIEVACKTGTAEFGDSEDKTHAWFTVFAPAQDPEIVVTVLLEKAGEGSYEAAPVAKEYLEYYFGEVKKQEN